MSRQQQEENQTSSDMAPGISVYMHFFHIYLLSSSTIFPPWRKQHPLRVKAHTRSNRLLFDRQANDISISQSDRWCSVSSQFMSKTSQSPFALSQLCEVHLQLVKGTIDRNRLPGMMLQFGLQSSLWSFQRCRGVIHPQSAYCLWNVQDKTPPKKVS